MPDHSTAHAGRSQASNEQQHDIVAHLPHLRGFAWLLVRDRTLADDLVQETIVRVLTHSEQFERGTNFKAWATTILRNLYFDEIRIRSRWIQLDVDALNDGPAISGGQEERLRLRDFERAFACLAAAQREALALVGASGFSYEDAARVAGASAGTMKSRVSRARLRLRQMLEVAPEPRAEAALFRADCQPRHHGAAGPWAPATAMPAVAAHCQAQIGRAKQVPAARERTGASLHRS